MCLRMNKTFNVNDDYMVITNMKPNKQITNESTKFVLSHTYDMLWHIYDVAYL